MPRFAANLSMMFTEHAFIERFEAAAAAGFTAVEYLFPYTESAARIRDALDAHGLTQALFNAPPGDWEGGEKGLAALPGREATFEAAMLQALDYAAVIRPAALHVMAGIAQGADARATYIANLKKAARMAGDLTLTIEPLNTRDNPGYHLTSVEDAAAVIAAVGAPNLTLQFDCYHTQIMEGDLTRRLARLAPIIGHIQIAGVPDRHEPDTGETALGHLMDQLDALGYSGWVGAEYRPKGRTEDGLGWFAPWRTR
ncbi:MAG: 2-oxo-tetronate isomerase [Pseudomonadota bacterium]